jgi:hypothetical protein
MRRAGIVVAVLAVFFAVAAPLHAQAQEVPHARGLFVAPVREYLTIAPGKTQHKQLTLANKTAATVTIVLSVEQFTVADFSYDYRFRPVKEDWIKMSATEVVLEPDKSKTVSYTVAPPAGAQPGGHYFTIFASSSLQEGAVKSNVRAASVLYVTVEGDLRTTTAVQNSAVPGVVFGGDIPFSLDVKNTGNTHFFMYVSGELQGFSAKGNGGESTRLLLPGTTLKAGGTLPAPLLPGVYTALFGYKTDAGEVIRLSATVTYIPLWSIVVPLGIVWVVIVLVRRLPRHRRTFKDF